MTTRFPSGVNNAANMSTLSNMGQMDPTRFQTLFNDFNDFTATDWAIVETQAGATQALAAGAGGQLLLTNSAAAADVNAITSPVASFRFDAGKRFFAKARISLSDVANVGITFGFGNTAAGLNPANGVYLNKAANAQTTTINVENTSVVASGTLNGPGVWANGVFRTLGFEYDPRTLEVRAYLDDIQVGGVSAATLNTSVDMVAFIGMSNNNTVANTATLDYVLWAIER